MNMFTPNAAKTPKEYFDMLGEPRKGELKTLDALIRKTAPSLKPFMQSGMVAYGKLHYVSPRSGKGVDWAVVLLSSRVQYISLYVCAIDGEKYLAEGFEKELPKASIGKSCIRFKKLEDVDQKVLATIVKKAETWAKNYKPAPEKKTAAKKKR